MYVRYGLPDFFKILHARWDCDRGFYATLKEATGCSARDSHKVWAFDQAYRLDHESAVYETPCQRIQQFDMLKITGKTGRTMHRIVVVSASENKCTMCLKWKRGWEQEAAGGRLLIFFCDIDIDIDTVT